MQQPTVPSASALLKSFDPRPLTRRAKFVLTLVGAVGLLLLGLAEIIWGGASPDVIERIVTWFGLIVLAGTGGITLDDARVKPILARALNRVVAVQAEADARPPAEGA